MSQRSDEDLCCPVCHDVFRDPVVLQCSHSLCRSCVRSWWGEKGHCECPVCKSISTQTDPPSNLALRNLCESLQAEKIWRSPSEAVCGLHSEKLTLFCLDHQDPICLVCRDAEKHVGHRFRPLDEAAHQHKNKLDEFLKPLRAKLEAFDKIRAHYVHTLEHIESQAQKSEAHIQEEFERLHRFLRHDEEARLELLRAEGEEKSGRMRDKMADLGEQIAPLTDAVKAAEEQLRADSVAFLQNYKSTVGRLQSCPPPDEPPPVAESLVDEAEHVGNLAYRVWTKMQDLVQFCPVLFDPNTVDPQMALSRDLTELRRGDEEVELPQNPERFRKYFAVLGSQGWSTGRTEWEVDVSRSSQWRVGVLAHGVPLEQAQWVLWLFNGVLAAQAPNTPLSVLRDLRPPRRLRLTLDCDVGHISFSDPQTHAHVHSLRFSPGLKMFPYVKTWDTASISRANVYVTVELRRGFEKPLDKGTDLLQMLEKVSNRNKNKPELADTGSRRREFPKRVDEDQDDIATQKRLNKLRYRELEEKALREFDAELENCEMRLFDRTSTEAHRRDVDASEAALATDYPCYRFHASYPEAKSVKEAESWTGLDVGVNGSDSDIYGGAMAGSDRDNASTASEDSSGPGCGLAQSVESSGD